MNGIHVFRLRRGSDLLISIIEYAQAHRIEAGCILSCAGCVSEASVRDASGIAIRRIQEPMEIVSLTGTVSAERTHLHVSFSKEDLSVVGGHLVEGCIVNTTAEVVLQEIRGVRFGFEFDFQTGYDELTVSAAT